MWSNPEETADLVTFTEEILDGKLHFLRSDNSNHQKEKHFEFSDLNVNFIWYSINKSLHV